LPVRGSRTIAIPAHTPTGTTDITLTLSATHNIGVGQTVEVAGVTPAGYNGVWRAQNGTTGSTLVLNIGSNPGPITVAGVAYISPQVSIVPDNIASSGLIIKALASQAANLAEFQSSSGAVLARVTPAGILYASQILSLNGLASMGEFNNGAIFELVRGTAQSYSPGLNRGTLYFRDGTTSGTLRLATRTGASGVEETIVDNISSTGSTAGAQFTGAGGVRTTGLINTNSSQYGNALLWSAPASTTYYLLATLPTSNAGTYDHLRIDATYGTWTDGQNSTSTFTFSNRNGFFWKHYLSGQGTIGNVKFRAYSLVNGSVEIWVSGEAGQFVKCGYNISSAQQVVTVANPVATTTAPTGTLVFDSSNVATYPPVENQHGALNILGTTTGTVPFSVRGANGQSVNLAEWKTWDGTTATTRTSIGSTGNISTSAGLSLTGANSPINLTTGGNGTAGQVIVSAGTGATPTWGVPTYPSTAQQLFLASPTSGSGIPTFRYISTSDFTQFASPSIGQALVAAPVTGGWAWTSFLPLTGGTVTGLTTFSGGVTLSGTTSPISLPTVGAGTSGQVLTSAGAGLTPTWTTVGGTFTGGTLTSTLILDDGTTTTAPLKFDATGTSVLTTPQKGAVEYDGKVSYLTPDTTPGRAVNWTPHHILFASGPDFSGSSAAVSIIDGATKGITLLAGMTYEFELHVALRYQSFGDTTTALNIGYNTSTVSGTPTVAWSEYLEYSSNTTGFATAAAMNSLRRTTGTFQIATSPGASGSRYVIYKAKGTIAITGSGSIKFYPTLSPSAITANVPTYQTNSFFMVTPLGNGTYTQVGAWA
jgi:hypothetical protein